MSKLSATRKLSYDDVAAQMKSYDHKYIKGFLSDLLEQKKIEKKTAQEVLFHLMDEGKISKAYVAKMMQDLEIL